MTCEIFDHHTMEIEYIIREYQEKTQGIDSVELLKLRRDMNTKLIDLLTQQKRALDFMAGDPIEPRVHFGESILLPAFGGGS